MLFLTQRHIHDLQRSPPECHRRGQDSGTAYEQLRNGEKIETNAHLSYVLAGDDPSCTSAREYSAGISGRSEPDALYGEI